MNISKFLDLTRECKTALWKALVDIYSKEMNRKDAKALAYLVSEYLMGHEIFEIIEKSDFSLRNDLINVQDRVKIKADLLMFEQSHEKELILRLNSVQVKHFNEGLDQKYLIKKLRLVDAYKNDFKDLEDIKQLQIFIKNYRQKAGTNSLYFFAVKNWAKLNDLFEKLKGTSD